jgi:hypothetical protein
MHGKDLVMSAVQRTANTRRRREGSHERESIPKSAQTRTSSASMLRTGPAHIERRESTKRAEAANARQAAAKTNQLDA